MLLTVNDAKTSKLNLWQVSKMLMELYNKVHEFVISKLGLKSLFFYNIIIYNYIYDLKW